MGNILPGRIGAFVPPPSGAVDASIDIGAKQIHERVARLPAQRLGLTVARTFTRSSKLVH